FADDAEGADFAGGAGVRAAAKLHGIAVERLGSAADLDDADAVAVFLAEELHDVLAALDFGVGNFRPGDAGVFDDALVDEALDVGDLRGRERLAAEVEGQFVRADVGTLLRGVRADDLVESPMKQVRDGMVA